VLGPEETTGLGTAPTFCFNPSVNRGGKQLARQTVLVSDLTGDVVQEGAGGKIRLTFADARRGSYELDVTGNEPEVKKLMEKGRKVARRGRPAKTT
jgi:hypothetical protein